MTKDSATGKTASAKPAEKKNSTKAASSMAAIKFAQSNGCKVTGKGAQLIDSRRDSEIHKVSCMGQDSLLVQCRKGNCKGLL